MKRFFYFMSLIVLFVVCVCLRLKLLFFYRTGSGSEVDFVIETRKRQRISKAHIVCFLRTSEP
jgi:branched-subunit amino acid ABC-type transport system permease component